MLLKDVFVCDLGVLILFFVLFLGLGGLDGLEGGFLIEGGDGVVTLNASDLH